MRGVACLISVCVCYLYTSHPRPHVNRPPTPPLLHAHTHTTPQPHLSFTTGRARRADEAGRDRGLPRAHRPLIPNAPGGGSRNSHPPPPAKSHCRRDNALDARTRWPTACSSSRHGRAGSGRARGSGCGARPIVYFSVLLCRLGFLRGSFGVWGGGSCIYACSGPSQPSIHNPATHTHPPDSPSRSQSPAARPPPCTTRLRRPAGARWAGGRL